jgi:hypothetical protein
MFHLHLHFYISPQRLQVTNKAQNCRNQGFSWFFLLVGGKIRIKKKITVPDPGGPKTYGFGSGTLEIGTVPNFDTKVSLRFIFKFISSIKGHLWAAYHPADSTGAADPSSLQEGESNKISVLGIAIQNFLARSDTDPE